MDPLSQLLHLPLSEKQERGLVHTPHEIAQQPGTWQKTFTQLEARLPELQKFLAKAGIGGNAEARPIVFLIGAGTSDYIGHSLHLLLRQQWQCEVVPVASTSLLVDFAEWTLPDRPYLWISFSRSGDSPEGVAVLERALAECPNVAQLLVTCNAEGRMNQAVAGRENCFALVLDDATNDRSLAMTSSFTNMVLTGQILAHAQNLAAYRPILDSLVEAGVALLPRAAELASRLIATGFESACFVGSGALAGAAKESALKVLELTAGQIPTMSESTMGLRHGPMAALQRSTLFVALVASQPQQQRYALDLLKEIGSKELVETRVAVALEATDEIHQAAEEVLTPGVAVTVPDLYRPVLDVFLGQILGLLASIDHGLKPDAPSPSGAISRVVQNVGIY